MCFAAPESLQAPDALCQHADPPPLPLISLGLQTDFVMPVQTGRGSDTVNSLDTLRVRNNRWMHGRRSRTGKATLGRYRRMQWPLQGIAANCTSAAEVGPAVSNCPASTRRHLRGRRCQVSRGRGQTATEWRRRRTETFMSGGGGITTVRSGSDLSCLISCCSMAACSCTCSGERDPTGRCHLVLVLDLLNLTVLTCGR